MRARLVAGPVAALALGCSHLPGAPPRLRECPGPLRASQEIPAGLVHDERIRVRGGAVDEAFALLVRRRDDQLVVVGLNAFGAKAFSIVQDGLAVRSESHLGPALAVPPENVLRDLHRARFLAADAGERALVREPDGGLRVVAGRCGYETTFAPAGPASPAGRASLPVAVSGSAATKANARGTL